MPLPTSHVSKRLTLCFAPDNRLLLAPTESAGTLSYPSNKQAHKFKVRWYVVLLLKIYCGLTFHWKFTAYLASYMWQPPSASTSQASNFTPHTQQTPANIELDEDDDDVLSACMYPLCYTSLSNIIQRNYRRRSAAVSQPST